MCVNSNDFDEPSIPVEVTLIVTGTPEIDVTPSSRETTLCQGETDTQYLSICNVSTGPLEWSLSEVEEGLTDMGYALDLSSIPNSIVTFALNDFTGQTVVAPTNYDYFGMDFDPSGTVLYALNDTTDYLGTIDLTTGAFTGLVPCPPGGDAGYWTGMAIDPQSGVFYGSTTNELFTINPATGDSTLVGAFGAATTMIAIAVNAEGQMYGHDIGTDKIYQINTATGAATEVGPTGYSAN